jgi:hypothetical protein
MLKFATLAGLAFVLAACAPAPAPQTPPTPPAAPRQVEPPKFERRDGYDAAAEKTCLAKSGSYQIGGLLGRFYCTIPFSDGGKPCTDKADCQGRCLAVPGQRMGEKGVGKCAPNDSVFGCNAPVDKGIVGPVLCVD